MEKRQYDVEGHIIAPVRRFPPCLFQGLILATVMVGAFAGTLFYHQYFYHPHRHVVDSSPTKQGCQDPSDLIYVKFSDDFNDSIMTVSLIDGSHLAIMHYRDPNKTFRKYHIADMRYARLVDRLLLLLKNDVIIPNETEMQLGDSLVGSQFLVKICCRQGRLEIGSIEKITPTSGPDLRKYADTFEVKERIE